MKEFRNICVKDYLRLTLNVRVISHHPIFDNINPVHTQSTHRTYIDVIAKYILVLFTYKQKPIYFVLLLLFIIHV